MVEHCALTDWFSPTQKEVCITLWYNIVDLYWTSHPLTVGLMGRFVWEKETERRHAHWRCSLDTVMLASVRVLDWFSSTQKEFCITLWYNIVDHCWSVAKMILVYYCRLVSGRRNQRLGYDEGDLSWKPDLGQTYGYTKYQQEETTHKYGLPPRLSHASDKLAVLFGHHKTESLAVEWWTVTSVGAKGPEVPSPYFFVPSCEV
jgi:hypothetical protein